MDTVKWDHFMFLSNIHLVETTKENELGQILNNLNSQEGIYKRSSD